MDEALQKILEAHANFYHNTEAGRTILAAMMKEVNVPTYRPGMRTEDTLWLEGRRSFVLDILHYIGEGNQLIETAGQSAEHAVETDARSVMDQALDGPLGI